MLIAVTDLAAAGRNMEEQYGLASIEGGHHPGWGTANRIVPLGNTYLELIAVVDALEAGQSVLGKWVAGRTNGAPQPIGWAVRTNDIDAIGRRLGLSISGGSRLTAAGDRLEWRMAGVEEAAASGALPFFIDWAARSAFPGQAPVKHPGGPTAIGEILIGGDPGRLAAWLGGQLLPITVTPGGSGLTGIVLHRGDGHIFLGADSR